MSYHNPYHFVPVAAGGRTGDVTREEFERGAVGRLRHDRFANGGFSGRLVCRLTAKSPLVLGAARGEASSAAPAEVEPFERDGRPAVPGSSLRGLLSSIAEAASNSALRVLTDQPYSFRRPMRPPERLLSAIGMIVEAEAEAGGGHLRLRVLTLPTCRDGHTVPEPYRLPLPNLKVYLADRRSIEDAATFHFRTFTANRPEFFGLKLRARTWPANGTFVVPNDPQVHQRNGLILSQISLDGHPPVPWNRIPAAEAAAYTRGIVRVLGCWNRDDIPTGKKHELFIPYPVAAERWPTLPIDPLAIERFEDLADQRTEDRSDLPYEPRDTDRGGSEGRLRLKPGDLVFFRADSTPRGAMVTEVAFSSIWRGRVEHNGHRATARTFFKTVDPELLPFGPERRVVTPAEQLFGFVEADVPREPRRPALALASRVFVSDARIHGQDAEPYLPAVTLRILDRPKPPSPALYFRLPRAEGGYISKTELRPGTHRPQGRKMYLHHRQQDAAAWESAHTDPADPKSRLIQKARVRPLKRGTEFWFHVDFENLSEAELGLLCYAVRPGPTFLHKLGMGKPLGLGSVCIDPMGLFLLDRTRRYTSDGVFAPRYARAWRANEQDPAPWPRAYEREHQVPADATAGAASLFEERRAVFQPASGDIAKALELIGKPGALRTRVHTPLVEGHEDPEDETFRWFVANDQGSGSEREGNRLEPARTHLRPIEERDTHLPTLEALPWND
jgi:CRISPR-associated protein (TIGR03986 family)